MSSTVTKYAALAMRGEGDWGHVLKLAGFYKAMSDVKVLHSIGIKLKDTLMNSYWTPHPAALARISLLVLGSMNTLFE